MTDKTMTAYEDLEFAPLAEGSPVRRFRGTPRECVDCHGES